MLHFPLMLAACRADSCRATIHDFRNLPMSDGREFLLKEKRSSELKALLSILIW